MITNRLVLDDLPTDHDLLDFGPYADALADVIASGSTSTPLTIGVFGTWGTGKTSLMNMIKARLPQDFCLVWFDAWKYDREDGIWRALILQMLSALRDIGGSDKSLSDRLTVLEASLYRNVDEEKLGDVTIDWGKAIKGSIRGIGHLSISLIPGIGGALSKLVEKASEMVGGDDLNLVFDAVRRERRRVHTEHLRSLEQFQGVFRQLVSDALKTRRRLVAFVDDLDRCSPEKAVEVLDALKVLIEVPGCVFVLGLDQSVIKRHIELKYAESGRDLGSENDGNYRSVGDEYLQKIIQLPFIIPPVERDDRLKFVSGIVDEWPHVDCAKVFAAGLDNNPRQIKRTINVFLLLWRLAQKRNLGNIGALQLAKLIVLQQNHPALYEALRASPGLLRDLEKFYVDEADYAQFIHGSEGDSSDISREAPVFPPVLAAYSAKGAVRQLLLVLSSDAGFAAMTNDELKSYFTLAYKAEVTHAERDAIAQPGFVEPQMIYIPDGQFSFSNPDISGDQSPCNAQLKSHHTDSYYIGKYPTSNSEYMAFVKDTKHRSPRDWSGADFPEDSGDCPVVWVSFKDAEDYCRWLSDKSGKTYRLPTEPEWEKASRGVDAYRYPWGEALDSTKLNSRESGKGRVTPVSQYSPQGDSPFGVSDTLGNVWEWTRGEVMADGQADRIEGDAVVCVRKGGAFFLEMTEICCSARSVGEPSSSFGSTGFRVACNI